MTAFFSASGSPFLGSFGLTKRRVRLRIACLRDMLACLLACLLAFLLSQHRYYSSWLQRQHVRLFARLYSREREKERKRDRERERDKKRCLLSSASKTTVTFNYLLRIRTFVSQPSCYLRHAFLDRRSLAPILILL